MTLPPTAIAPWVAVASPSTNTAAAADSVPFAAEIAGIVLPIIFLVGALVAVLVLLRKRQGMGTRDMPLTVMQVLPVGPRERVVVLRTRAGRALAVGVAAHSVRLIAALSEDDLGTTAQSLSTPDEV